MPTTRRKASEAELAQLTPLVAKSRTFELFGMSILMIVVGGAVFGLLASGFFVFVFGVVGELPPFGFAADNAVVLGVGLSLAYVVPRSLFWLVGALRQRRRQLGANETGLVEDTTYAVHRHQWLCEPEHYTVYHFIDVGGPGVLLVIDHETCQGELERQPEEIATSPRAEIRLTRWPGIEAAVDFAFLGDPLATGPLYYFDSAPPDRDGALLDTPFDAVLARYAPSRCRVVLDDEDA